ncbi:MULTISPECIES: tetratricopeptide repeat protein [Nannocystis]|uniref:Tetratricopeptide repeat protein n=1 Tax=Nannocystis radixulma TaxID=2995305 RepID=A0ABT5B003_9BACT|nr:MULTISPECIES: tetratricopeptide repeat protein [Nannocystis]MCY1054295.1 tetratricopeptide repeat protein [Nannocystis sp. SCPEA4]MDC0666803.1 tetratricopeptide repeat protein [Nannocystis radixulma]
MTAPSLQMLHNFDHGAALAHYEQAIARVEARFGASHPSLAGLHSSAAGELCQLGHYAAAITRAEQAIALSNLAGNYDEIFDEAQRVLARARARAYP